MRMRFGELNFDPDSVSRADDKGLADDGRFDI